MEIDLIKTQQVKGGWGWNLLWSNEEKERLTEGLETFGY